MIILKYNQLRAYLKDLFLLFLMNLPSSFTFSFIIIRDKMACTSTKFSLERALCTFYREANTNRNRRKLYKRYYALRDIGEVRFCYTSNPRKPMLRSKNDVREENQKTCKHYKRSFSYPPK